MATAVYPYVQYSGMWTKQAQMQAVAAGTWTGLQFGGLYSWGSNLQGQLGLGTSGAGTYNSSPNQVGLLTTWANITTGMLGNAGGFSLATKTDGTLWAWGLNNYGQLGLGNTISYSSPKQVGALTTWSKISEGVYTSVAIDRKSVV